MEKLIKQFQKIEDRFNEAVILLALSLPETTEEPHFDKIVFKIRKRIYATYDAKEQSVNIKLSEIDQDVFCKLGKGSIYPVANKWGKQGWTSIDLKSVDLTLFKDALITAYCELAPKKLAERVQQRQ